MKHDVNIIFLRTFKQESANFLVRLTSLYFEFLYFLRAFLF